ncbi:cupin domain-containing protein [Microvirga sp. BT689]|uniref:cupin domain-containing protein n=1 Tax=Microvirga arvi TaxID=2778731 RepID=UPI001952603A|nr:cupin domain-containing protein [Microvirga arvi]MBM6584441.1 cupin domain-containing protein [Microvirga arvi]
MRPLLLTTVLLLVTTGSVLAQDLKAGHAMRPDQLQWMPAPSVLPKGAQATVLSGDPSKAGPFTMRLKAPAGYKIPAHSHPTAERITVISGDFHFGMGDKLDQAKAEKLGSGGFVDLPANMNHYAFMGTDAVVQIDSMGPFAITYANPADDPSKSQ